MKRFAQIIVAAALTVFAAACTQETNTDIATAGFRKYSLAFAESTRTSLSGTGSTRQASWNKGDEILYYTAPYQSDAEIATVDKDGSSAHMVVPVSNATEFINAVYGAGELKSISSTGSYMYVTSPVTDSQSSTSFGQAHICAAFSADPEATTLQFHNAAAILTFKGGEAVYRVEFHGNGGEVITAGNDGALVISQDGDGIHVEPESVGGTTVSVQTGGSEDTFYVAILPVVFGNGIAVVSYDQNDKVLAKMQTFTELSAVSANGNARIISLGNAQNWKTNIGPEAVDLGLPSGTLWASCNLGATKPEEYGDYFAWGETEPKESYTWDTYKWGSETSLTKYNNDSSHGALDYKTLLDLEDDAAHANLGGDWRIPAYDDWYELWMNCTKTWTDDYNDTGVKGLIVTGPNSNSIFLPAAGRLNDVQTAGFILYYWFSTINEFRVTDAYDLCVLSMNNIIIGSDKRFRGFSIRPVKSEYVPVADISVYPTKIELEVKQMIGLSATVSPDNATSKSVYWTSSNPSVAMVNSLGEVTSYSAGTATIYAYASNGLYATCTVTVKNETPYGVDLGLPSGILWASWNVGANKQEEYGDYFAWGETESKGSYSWNNYLWENSNGTLKKYNSITDYGTVDFLNLLESGDDAASASYGSPWRMPAKADWEELRKNCKWTWNNDFNGTGVKGYVVSGKASGYTENSIFLPAAGAWSYTTYSDEGSFGHYWSSSLYTDNPFQGWGESFYSSDVELSGAYRYLGYSVRAVYNP